MEASASAPSKGIFDSANLEKREQVVELLRKAYWMEIETVVSSLAASVNLDGVRAKEIKESLGEDVEEELGHAKRFAERIKELYGVVPGSEDFAAEQSFLQPPEEQTDIVHVIRGVIKAETGAVEHYRRMGEETDGVDPVTQDMVIEILHDEQGHRRLFEGFLREYEVEGIAGGRVLDGGVPPQGAGQAEARSRRASRAASASLEPSSGRSGVALTRKTTPSSSSSSSATLGG